MGQQAKVNKWGVNLMKLQELKLKCDPNNMFDQSEAITKKAVAESVMMNTSNTSNATQTSPATATTSTTTA